MKVILEEMLRVRREAVEFAGQVWVQIGNEIYTEEKKWVLTASSKTTATYIASLHNLFLPLTNMVIMWCKKRKDRENMHKEMQG